MLEQQVRLHSLSSSGNELIYPHLWFIADDRIEVLSLRQLSPQKSTLIVFKYLKEEKVLVEHGTRFPR